MGRKSFRVLGFKLAIHLHIRMYAHLLDSMVTAGKTKTIEGKKTWDWAASGSSKGYVEEVLAQHPAMFSKLLEHAPRFRFQVLLSHVVQDPVSSSTHLVRHGYRVDHEYFYPASAIKLCAAVAAVEKLKHIQASLGVYLFHNFTILLLKPVHTIQVLNLSGHNAAFKGV
jgi:hypothetical protein